jgi:hypothetical protein
LVGERDRDVFRPKRHDLQPQQTAPAPCDTQSLHPDQEETPLKIACLHTIASNQSIFEDAKPAGAQVSHTVRSDLLADAERAGGMTETIEAAAVSALLELALGADAVLLTCSTIGSAAERASGMTNVPILRADAALAREAVALRQPVLVLCGVETTVGPSRRLFETAAAATGVAIDMEVVPDAWTAFKAGDIDTYHGLVSVYADRSFAAGRKVIALAQASMAGAADRCTLGRPLASPRISMAAAAQTRRL